MSKPHSLIKNSLFNLIKTFSSLIFPLITFTYSARILGVEGVGKVNFAKSFITYFALFAMLGMNYYGTREAAKLRDDRAGLSKFAHEMLLINGATTALAYSFLALALLFVPKLKGYGLLLGINSCAILLQGMGMEWLYQGLEEYRYIAVRSVLFQLLALALMFAFVRDAGDVAAYTVVGTVAAYGPYILNFLNVRKYVDFHRYGGYEIKKHMKPLLWLFALVVSIELYTVLDSTMLGFIQGDAAVGRYTAAVKVNKLTNSLITAIGVVLIPRLSFYVGQGDKEKVNALVEKAYNCVFLLSIPATVGLFMLSDEIILLFSGREFASAGLTMRLLTPIVLVIPFSVATNQQTLIPMGKEKLMLIATSLGAVVNLLCNAVMIPQFSENGAAIATVIAETVVAGVSLHTASKFFDMRRIFRRYYQYWLAAIPIPLLALLFRQLIPHYIIRICLAITSSASSYFIILLLLKNEYVLQIMQIVLHRRNI